MSQTFNNTRISLDKVLANILAENEDDFSSELSESSDDDICGDFEDDEGCQHPFMLQNTRTTRPDACERRNILEHENEIVSTYKILYFSCH